MTLYLPPCTPKMIEISIGKIKLSPSNRIGEHFLEIILNR